MTPFVPENREQLCQALREANANRRPIGPVDLRNFQQVLEYCPEDMTITVESGLTLSKLQETLRAHGQWLPIDPPNPSQTTLLDLLHQNASGPRRFGFGAVREHLLGLKAALADGRLIKSGGKVVKNVAGYDLLKLFVGSQGTLGIVLEASLKVMPLPEAEKFVSIPCPSLEAAGATLDAVLRSEITPMVLDLHNLAPSSSQTPLSLVLGFAGNREEVEWQLAQASEFGIEPSDLAHEELFWSRLDAGSVRRLSILPSALTSALRNLGAISFVARAGNGIIYYRGGPNPPSFHDPARLNARIKEAFDPNRVFPEIHL